MRRNACQGHRTGRLHLATQDGKGPAGMARWVRLRPARRSSNAVALLATTLEQPALVFAQSPGLPFDMATLMKQTMARLGGRYGGSKDMAQGGVPTAEGIEAALCNVVAALI